MAREAPDQIDRRRYEVCRQIDQLVDRGAVDGRDVYLFGATLDFHWYVEHLHGRGIVVQAVIDNAPYKHGRSYAGTLVLGPDALREARDPVILITSPPYAYEMAEQLSAMGFVAGRDHFIVTGTRTTRLGRLRDLARDIGRAWRGYRVLKRIQRRHGRDAHVLLCPYPGTGDAYLQGMYIPAYVEANRLAHPVIVANGRLVGKVLALFDLEVQEVIDQDETDALNAALQFFGERLVPVTALQFRGMRTRPGPNAYIAEDVPNFREVFERDVFGLADPEIRSPRFDTDEAAVAEFFTRERLEPGRTAVIAPYMGSHWNIQIPMSFWESLAADLRNAGWQVCTNSSGPSEPAIPGTQAVFFPLAQAVPILDRAGLFVAIRSGLCDVVSSTTATQIVLYLGGSHVIMRHYYSLTAMGLAPRAHEFEYDDNDAEVLSAIDEIVRGPSHETGSVTGRVDE